MIRRTEPRRDGWVCRHVRYDIGELCAEPARHCDHIVHASEGGSDDPSNLRVCFARTLSMPAAPARRRPRATGALPEPGDVR
ncbi:HNH endonuclease [Kitasatospora griseola]|uniref:HNH endonuclease n=1 Tax=Kitasatospora griseola TaxID=2064 RepID=UPI0034263C01